MCSHDPKVSLICMDLTKPACQAIVINMFHTLGPFWVSHAGPAHELASERCHNICETSLKHRRSLEMQNFHWVCHSYRPPIQPELKRRMLFMCWLYNCYGVPFSWASASPLRIPPGLSHGPLRQVTGFISWYAELIRIGFHVCTRAEDRDK